ncbi:MAG: PQQ-binding-like beta-propeller repeat protein [Bryobacterales bacterium]|nr:PQQ-binding-like beta-propeller repeat protein [Bryobacterales bacterium]
MRGSEFGTLLLTLLSAASVCPAADWPRFRGPNGAGVSESGNLPAQFGPDRNVVWKTALAPGLSSPVIGGNQIYVTGLEGGRLATIALSRDTGQILWTRYVDRRRSEKLHKLNHPASPSVAVEGDDLFSFFPDFGLVSYTKTGGERWRLPLGPFTNSYGVGVSPVVAGNKVILVIDQDRDSFIAAYDVGSGRPLWRTPRPKAVSGHSTPVIYKNWVIAPGSVQMNAYNLDTGKVEWTADGLPSEMKSVPAIEGDLIYVHGFNTPENDPGRLIAVPTFREALGTHDKDGNGKLSKEEAPTPHSARLFEYLDTNHDGVMDEREWERYADSMKAENAMIAFRIGGGQVWKFQRSIPQLPSPLVYRGIVYMVNEGGILTTLDAATGKLHKQARVRGEADRYYASPVAADGKVYIASHTGVVSVLKAGPDQELLGVNPLEDEILATPALVDGKVYIRTKSHLFCFGAR